MEKLICFTQNTSNVSPIVRFDPAVNKAVTFAIADKLIYQGLNGKYTLTNKGKKLIEEIDMDKDILMTEKEELSILSKKLTDEKIRQLSIIWRTTYAEN